MQTVLRGTRQVRGGTLLVERCLLNSGLGSIVGR